MRYAIAVGFIFTCSGFILLPGSLTLSGDAIRDTALYLFLGGTIILIVSVIILIIRFFSRPQNE